jgi:hypothetical protein
MPHRTLTTTEMAAAQKLFDHIMAAEYGGSPAEDETMETYTLRVWERCAAAVIEPSPDRKEQTPDHAATRSSLGT